MAINTHFDARKGIEVILYIASKAPVPDIYRICKILYFADKQHLADFGRQICGDRYAAMKNGPVPSAIYDLYKDVSTGRASSISMQVVEQAKSSFNVKGNNVLPLREPDLDEFSMSDLQTLDRAIAEYGNKSFSRLRDLSHDFAWTTTYERRPNAKIHIEDLVKASYPEGHEKLLEHLYN